MADRIVRSHEAVPMWVVGWNVLSTPPSELPVQKVWCLPQINQSPTSNSVVQETLRRSLQIAEESGRECIASTFDLAIAKIAFQIKEQEAPAFDKVFILLGAFHIELAYLKIIGKYIEKSGIPYILTETGDRSNC